MIVLHAGINEDQLFLWGETEDIPEAKKAPDKGPKFGTNAPLPYAMDLGPKLFCLILLGLFQGILSPTGNFCGNCWPGSQLKDTNLSLVLFWETSAQLTAQIPNSPVEGNRYKTRTDETVDLLCFCLQTRTLAQGLVIGDDLAYWAEALRFAGSMVARQRYIPEVIRKDEEFHAQWEAIFSAEDSESVTSLAKIMPPVARSLSSIDLAVPPQSSSSGLLKKFIVKMVDHLVRSSNPDRFSGPGSRKGPTFDSLHDVWLHALQSPDSLIHGQKSELNHLWQTVRNWNRPIAVAESSPFRLCFRIEEPTPPETIQRNHRVIPDEKWRVHYLIQSCSDPSLIVPAKDAWKPKPKMLSALKTNPSNIREYLLLSLGQAGSICPNIEKSLKSAQPDGYALDTVSAHEFLTEKAVLLKQSGFTVMFPGWWTRSGTKERITLKATVKGSKLKASSGLSLGAIVDFDWEVALGGVKLSLPELKALAKLKSPLVQLRGQWVEVSVEEIQAAVDSWKKKELSKTTVGDLIKMAVGAKDSHLGLELKGVTARGWVGDLLQQLEGSSPIRATISGRYLHWNAQALSG